jgi:hypothetical protein
MVDSRPVQVTVEEPRTAKVDAEPIDGAVAARAASNEPAARSATITTKHDDMDF